MHRGGNPPGIERALPRAVCRGILSAFRSGRPIHAADAALRVVTHVEQVKERIPAHIDVEKRGDGRSVLSGPGVIAS